jgi:hypothetical protein
MSREHYRNPAVYRVPSDLPSVFFQALGKESLPSAKQKTLDKKKHSAKNSLPSVFFTLGKEYFKSTF